MAAPFNIQPLRQPTLFHRVLGRLPKRNALIEINNLLATAKDLKEVAIEEVAEIAAKYRINPIKTFAHEREGVYADYLRWCLSDKALSDNEIVTLSHLKGILGLNEDAIRRVQSQVSATVYREAVDQVIADGRLETEEKAFLDKVRRELTLPEDVAQSIYSSRVSEFYESRFKSAIADQRLSPAQEEELAAISKSLGVTVQYDEKTQHLLNKYRLFWLVENAQIPEITTDINLQRGEKCYLVRGVDWYEHRRVTKRVRYSGPTYRLKIAKGLYWRIGDLSVRTVSEDLLAHIDSGRLFLTNKRLLFLGGQRNTTIRLSQIVDFKPFKNGVEVEKDSGRSPFLAFEEDVDIFVAILRRAIADGA